MASATVDTNAAADICRALHLDSIHTIDLDLISQSELYTLSFCSSSTFDPRRCDDLVIPKIDRSVFNESAGSRKQTYSRLRLAPATSPNSPSALRRRRPVIRSTNFNAPAPYLDSDPEVAETKQIVGLLKKLLGVEDNNIGNVDYAEVGNELIPVRVDYSDAMLQTSNAGPEGLKRKRGRPAKNENVLGLVGYKVENTCENGNIVSGTVNGVVIHENAVDRDGVFTNNNAVDLVDNKVESECENSGVKMVMVNDIVMRGHVEDREREMVNRDGNVVDLVELGLMENPYGEELGRRTEGMIKEEELLRFMNDLNGEWVSRRRKRRIVDASEFGNALPKGWRLMLACKKKDGRIWIYCRRYMSPNGRQFASCKEISEYLLSLHSIQDANQITCAQQILNFGENNVNVEASDNFEVTNTAVLVGANEKREDNDVTRFLSQAFASMSGDFGVKVIMEAPRDQQVVQGVVSCLNCDSCDLSFNCQDELLHHQLYSHRRKKSKTSVTDGVIIREGKFECQFCHKTFDERKRYNGHMGSHVRGQGNVSDESRVAAYVKEAAGGPLSVEHSSCKDSILQTVIAKECNVASKVTGEGGGNQPKSSLPQSGVDKPGVFNEAFGDKLKFDDSMDVDVLETNEDFGFEAALSSGSNEAAKGSVDSSDERERISIGCLPLPLDEQTITLRSSEVADESKKSSNEKGISECCSPPPFDKKTDSFVSNEAADVSEKYPNEQERISEGCSPLLLDKQTGSFNEANGSEQFCNEQERPSEACSPLPMDKQMGCFDDMINGLFESNRETISGGALPGSNENLDSCDIDWDSTDFSHTMDELGLDGNKTVDNDPVLGFCDKSGVDDSLVVNGHDESHIYGTKEHARSIEFDRNAVNRLEKDSSAKVNEKSHNEISSDQLKGQKQSKSLFSSLSSFGADNHADNVSSRMIQEHQRNDTQIENNAGIGFPFPTSNNVPIMPTVSKDKDETNFGFRSFFPSQNGKMFSADFNRGSLQMSAVEESKEPLFIRESPHEAYSTNKIFPNKYNDNGNTGSRNSNNNGLCLAFESQANSSVNQMEQYGAKGFGGIHPGMDQTYGVPRNMNNFGLAAASVAGNNPMEGGRGFRSGLHDSSFSDKSSKFGNNFDLGYPGRIWDGSRLDQTGNSNNKFMADFVNTNPQPVGDVMSRNIWRTSEADFMQNSVNTAPPLSQPLNNFHTFDILSEKVHGGLFEVDQKYNNSGSYEGLTLGRSEPTEYTFMASTQNSNSLPGGSKGFSYNVQATQPGFNSSYWQGKDALMPSMAVQNRVPSVCVWCRNEFYEDSLPSAVQTGAVGSMCASCSSRFAHPFNVL